nr:DUF3397 domain-containing protein [Lysinibacillus timonensis]
MKWLLQYIISTVILFPILLFFLTYYLCRKRKISEVKSIGLAADATTFILFFSVPLMITSLWDIHLSGLIICLALVIAMVFTFIDWRTKKEIEIVPLLKKTWRVYFILLFILYILIWIFGIIHRVIVYVYLQ